MTFIANQIRYERRPQKDEDLDSKLVGGWTVALILDPLG